MQKKIVFLFFLLCFLVHSALIFAEELSNEKKNCDPSTSLSVNPFKLPNYRIVPGTSFRIDVDKGIFKEEDKVLLTFIYKVENQGKTKHIDIKEAHLKKENDSFFIEAVFPEFRE